MCPEKAADPWGADSGGLKETLLYGVEITPREGAILGVVRPTEKHWECLLRCTQQKAHSVGNNGMHSILKNGTTCDAAFSQNSLTTYYGRRMQGHYILPL